ncbi:MAG: hypothetical protein RSH26_01690 [Clostridia bacterium]
MKSRYCISYQTCIAPFLRCRVPQARRHRILRAVAAALLIAVLAPGAWITASAEDVIGTVYVKPDVSPFLNGRTEQGLGGELEARFSPGDALDVVEYGDDWLRVLGGECGTVWVRGDYVTSAAPGAAPEAYRVTGGRLKLRDLPNGQFIRWLKDGSTVNIVGWSGDWAELEDGGYADGAFLEAVDSWQ